MRHPSEAELIDIAEGVVPEASRPHLATCAQCREQVADLRVMMAHAAATEVPEPSPLFWDHLSARVREAVENEGAHTTRLPSWWTWRTLVPIAALAGLVLAAALTLLPDSSLREEIDLVGEDMPMALDTEPIEDSSLSVLADLTSELDWDAASEAGLAPRAGTIDDLVTTWDPAERVELQRLLEQALVPPGA